MSEIEQEKYGDNSYFKPIFIGRLLQIKAFYIITKEFFTKYDKKIQKKYDEVTLKLARLQGNEEILASDFKPFFMSLLYIHIRTTLDLYFNNVLEYLFINNIDILKNSNKQYSTEEILFFNNRETLISYLAMKEVQRFNENNSKDKIEYLKKLLNNEEILTRSLTDIFVEVSEIRNILVYNEGRINDRFRKLVNNSEYDDKIHVEIDEEKLIKAIDSMISFINLIDKEFCDKFRISIWL